MQAKIFTQELLDEDTLRTSSQSSITKMMGKHSYALELTTH